MADGSKRPNKRPLDREEEVAKSPDHKRSKVRAQVRVG